MDFMNFFKVRTNAILSIILVFLSVIITVQAVISGSVIRAGEVNTEAINAANINPNFANGSAKGVKLTPTQVVTAEPTEAPTKKPKDKTAETTKPTEATTAQVTTAASATRKQPSTTIAQTAQLATAIPVDEPADYQAQWDAGYVIAIDNPDFTYQTFHIELSDEDRALLENLCYGEFGSGGFVGAALIAQCVKDAMCFDGYTSVAEVIKQCRYDGPTNRGTTLDCQQAVTYVFDMDHEAVQHRLLYMYNPYLVVSTFHESQNYILTYEDVRFFDRWNY